MIVFVALLGLITLLGVQKRKKEEPFLSKEMTTTVNGIFVLCIFLTHSSEYISFSGMADSLYRHFQNFHNQWIVTTFLAFSGYGVMSQIVKYGDAYLAEYPKNRLLKTLFNFDIAVLLYLVMNLILGINYSTTEIIGSFVGITSVGNSNWYIFAILVMYLVSYLSACLFRKNYVYQAVGVTVGTIAYIIIMQLFDMPSRFISTILCYPAGVWLCVYKKQIYILLKKYTVQSISIIAVILLVTYKFRYNDYIMNLSSIYFVLAIVCFNTFFTIKSKMLQFVGKHAFSIYILQRIPMIFFEHYGFMKEYRYIFVIVVGLCTILIAVLFDNLIKKINSSLFANKNIQKM